MASQPLTPDQEKARLKQYRLSDIIPSLAPMPPLSGPSITISPEDKQWSKYYHRVSPKDLDHLKLLAGVPDAAAAHPMYKAPLREVSYHTLPGADRMNAKMGVEESQSLFDMAHNILFGSYDAGLLEKGPLSPVVDFMLKKADGMTVFAAQDLIVNDGQTVTFDRTATLYFNRVIVHGTGKIVIAAQVKLVADTIEYLPN